MRNGVSPGFGDRPCCGRVSTAPTLSCTLMIKGLSRCSSLDAPSLAPATEMKAVDNVSAPLLSFGRLAHRHSLGEARSLRVPRATRVLQGSGKIQERGGVIKSAEKNDVAVSTLGFPHSPSQQKREQRSTSRLSSCGVRWREHNHDGPKSNEQPERRCRRPGYRKGLVSTASQSLFTAQQQLCTAQEEAARSAITAEMVEELVSIVLLEKKNNDRVFKKFDAWRSKFGDINVITGASSMQHDTLVQPTIIQARDSDLLRALMQAETRIAHLQGHQRGVQFGSSNCAPPNLPAVELGSGSGAHDIRGDLSQPRDSTTTSAARDGLGTTETSTYKPLGPHVHVL
ncbi:uncharacterized protein TEOVI_000800900 [Trypanosoma equiperdum]|uniref:Uncharacterized protein n=2 Tax=Trypanozoon TaxID=39700 RepID=Q57X34_TRYB2|nr:hypothetical protein, conserved [Trypanosoma brucei brucei TREU927]AAX69835.1 hypothetical protein, conserved [Trypanosoma brucei]AAZ13312.1 hypothetical protein, conserved [Trypanosoma brucei brucei TREU927]SCU67185.1 hypothetical protein, conserved [Trypanosoma equiperdum]